MNKILLFKSVCIVDYEKEHIEKRQVTDDLNGYILKLFKTIKQSDKLQYFKEKDRTTQVINNVLQILEELYNNKTKLIPNNMETIANRLHEKEKKAQKQVEHMGVEVKKGSLLQAVFFNEETKTYEYLITKTEHNKYMEQKEYSIEEGFKVDEKNLWKSCLIECERNKKEFIIKDIKVYLDNKAKYWEKDFLELEVLREDEQNTQQLFSNVERILKKIVHKHSKEDYNVLRNTLINYIRSEKQIDYYDLVKNKFENYQFRDLELKYKDKLIKELKNLPSNGKFDTQFASKPEALTARIIKETYKLTDCIDLVIKDIKNDDKIVAEEGATGERYIKIETNNMEVFERFKKDN